MTPKVEIVGNDIDEAILALQMPDETKERVPRSRRNNRKNTEECHFEAPLRGVALSAKNR